MGRSFSKFLASADQLGGPVSLSYRGERSYGSAAGGLCSMCTCLIILTFIFVQVFALRSMPRYSVHAETSSHNVNPYTPVLAINDYK